jgi:hypothetical protein
MVNKPRAALAFAFLVLAGTTSAGAHDSFGFNIILGAPSYYVVPPVIYAPPPVYYSPPPVIYYERAPVYSGPGAYFGYYDEPRFVHERGYYRDKHDHRHDHRHGHGEDDD